MLIEIRKPGLLRPLRFSRFAAIAGGLFSAAIETTLLPEQVATLADVVANTSRLIGFLVALLNGS